LSILIATPCYAGQLTLAYFNSCLSLQEEFLAKGIDHSWLTTGNESLITRARNTSVATFMKTDFEFLLFIDADIEFSPEDVAKLWNLQEKVSCGAYSMKRMDKPVSAWKDGKLVILGELSESTPVDYAGTGFLMIHRSVFEQMKEEYPELKHEEGHVGECYAFFDTEIVDGVYMSEDFNFCRLWRNMGGEIILDPSIKLGHHGQHCYRG